MLSWEESTKPLGIFLEITRKEENYSVNAKVKYCAEREKHNSRLDSFENDFSFLARTEFDILDGILNILRGTRTIIKGELKGGFSHYASVISKDDVLSSSERKAIFNGIQTLSWRQPNEF